jgi:hypothetical protein
MELPEISKSSAADEPENREKANWMQVREAVAASSRALFRASCYEHTRDQGTIGSVAACRHSRIPGRT